MASALRQKVLDHVRNASISPVLGSDPKTLKALQDAATDSIDGEFSASHAPIAERTWEAGDILLSTSPQTQRIPMAFPYAVEILGLNPVIEVLTTPGGVGAIAPTLSSIDVQIDINSETMMSSAQGNYGSTAAAPQATKDGTFVSLASIGVSAASGNRLMRWKLVTGSREVGLVFKWKRGINVYFDTIIRLTFFVRRLSNREIVESPG